jgi:hypothetical protein
MSRPGGLLLVLVSLALSVAPEGPAAAPPRAAAPTGLRVVATIRFSGGAVTARATISAGVGLPVKVFAVGGKKAVAEARTDGGGVCVLALPAGKYRVEAVAFGNDAARRQGKSALVEVKEGAVAKAKFQFLYARR